MTVFGFLAIVMWGTLALLGNYTKTIPPFQLLFICFLVSSLLLFIKRLIQSKPLFSKPRLKVKEWIVGIGGLFGFHFCYFMALSYTSAINVSLIAYLWPMFLALLLTSREDKARALVGSLMGFIGVSVLLVQKQQVTLQPGEVIGYLFAFSCALIWAVYSFLSSKLSNHVDDIGWLSLVVAALSLIAHLLLEPTQWQFKTSTLIAALLLGLGPVGGAFYLWDLAMKEGNTKLLASLSYASPLISALLLILFDLASWSSAIFIALALVLCGGLIATSRSN